MTKTGNSNVNKNGTKLYNYIYALLGNKLPNKLPKQPEIWLRFIEGMFMIWKDGEQQLRGFLEALNNYHPTIKFTHTMDKYEIAFLDTVVYRSPTNIIYTRIFHKPTNQKQYLHYYSAHPRNHKESVPYDLLIICRGICTEDHYFEKEAKKKKKKKNTQPVKIQEIPN